MVIYMAHKTITISVEAYNALKQAKEDYESFTDIILKLTRKREKPHLMDVLRSLGPQPELADNIENAMKSMRKARMRKVVI
jgi:predicted CopG family antitoxin